MLTTLLLLLICSAHLRLGVGGVATFWDDLFPHLGCGVMERAKSSARLHDKSGGISLFTRARSCGG